MPNNNQSQIFPKLEFLPLSFGALTNPPRDMFYCGDTSLLDNPHKIAIVGTRKPNPYTKSFVGIIASQIAKLGGVVVSGGALGVDIIAHSNALPRTIMVSPSSLDVLYPRSNAPTIKTMMEKSLVLSEYECQYTPHKHSFLERNRLVVALSDYVIIPQADMYSGSISSATYAHKLSKPLFVLPHRIGESEGTNTLLRQGKATPIYAVNEFLELIFGDTNVQSDDIIEFCSLNPTFEEAFARFGEKIYEYELEGKIIRESGSIRVV